MKNQKSAKAKRINFTQFHGRIVKAQGSGWQVIAHNVGHLHLAQAENTMTKETVNLMTARSPLAMSIRQSLGVGNYL